MAYTAERIAPASMIPGIVLGLGLGGFIDGIALHQIAQWHNMGSAVLPPTTMEAMHQNMVWDGWFHAATLVVTIIGVYLLLRDARSNASIPSARRFTGQMILGWGIFNLVEGLIDHHLLELHHVRDMPAHVPAYDWLFLAIGGVGLILVGWLMSRGSANRATAPAHGTLDGHATR
ncbi:MAG: DUF2243 domain-containing protein [Burkholderiaceae bacterium]